MLPWKPLSLPWITPRWSAASTAATCDLELRRLVALAVVVLLDAERGQHLLLARLGLVLHLHVGVERDEAAVLQLGERVDLGERHVAVAEELGEPGDDGGEALERLAGHAGGGDHLLGLVVGDRLQVRDVTAPDVVGVLLGHLLDVDPAHVGEQDQRLLGGAVPDHARVVLLLDLGLGVDQHAARHVAVDLQLQDVLGVLRRPRRACRRTARRRPSSARR